MLRLCIAFVLVGLSCWGADLDPTQTAVAKAKSSYKNWVCNFDKCEWNGLTIVRFKNPRKSSRQMVSFIPSDYTGTPMMIDSHCLEYARRIIAKIPPQKGEWARGYVFAGYKEAWAVVNLVAMLSWEEHKSEDCVLSIVTIDSEPFGDSAFMTHLNGTIKTTAITSGTAPF